MPAGVQLLNPTVDGQLDGSGSPAVAIESVVPRLVGRKALTIVLNDPQRGTSSAVVLTGLARALPGVRFRALVATGTHLFRPEGKLAFEEHLLAALPLEAVAWHDCRSAELVRIAGQGDWYGHPWLLEGEGPLLAIGSSEPHYFAGITGAHKTVTIGCAAHGDIEANHAGALSGDARPGRLTGNPVHEGIAAMVAALRRRRDVLVVNLLEAGGRILAATSGEPLEALERIAPAVRSTYFVSIPSPADALVLAVDGVLGENFYQADKGIKNNEWAVRDGGALVLEAACPDGIGQAHFLELLRACPTHASALAEVRRRGYRLGDHKAVKLRYLTDRRGVRVFCVSRGLTGQDARVLGFEKAPSAEEALAAAGVDPARHAVYRVADAGNACVVPAQAL